MEQMKDFVIKYFKIIVATLTFVLALYVQHVNNTAQIAALEIKCAGLELTFEQFPYIRSDLVQITLKGIELPHGRFKYGLIQFHGVYMVYS